MQEIISLKDKETNFRTSFNIEYVKALVYIHIPVKYQLNSLNIFSRALEQLALGIH